MLKNSDRILSSAKREESGVLWLDAEYRPYKPEGDIAQSDVDNRHQFSGAAMNLAPCTQDRPKRTPYVSTFSGKSMPMSVVDEQGTQLLELWNINRDHEFSHLVSMMVKDYIFGCDERLKNLLKTERELIDFSHFDEFLTMICDYFFENKKGETYACYDTESLVENISTFYRHHSLHYFSKLKEYGIPKYSPDDIGQVELKYYVCFIDADFRGIISELAYLIEEWFAYLGGVSEKLYHKRVGMGLVSRGNESIIDDGRYEQDRTNDYLIIESIRDTLVEVFAEDSYEKYVDWEKTRYQGQQLRIIDFLKLVDIIDDSSEESYYKSMVKKLKSRKSVRNSDIKGFDEWKSGFVGEYEFRDLMIYFDTLHVESQNALTIIDHIQSVVGDTITTLIEDSDGNSIQSEFSSNYLLSWYHNWSMGGMGVKKKVVKTKQIFQTFVYSCDLSSVTTISKTARNIEYANRLYDICRKYIAFVRENENPGRLREILDSRNKSVAERAYEDSNHDDAIQLLLF
jgi:hypothetical protein